MLRIAGQTAGPIGLIFVVDTQGVAGGCYRLKKMLNFFSLNFSKQKCPRAMPVPSASVYNIRIKNMFSIFPEKFPYVYLNRLHKICQI